MGFRDGLLQFWDNPDRSLIKFNKYDILVTDKKLWACYGVNDPGRRSFYLRVIIYDEAQVNSLCEEIMIGREVLSQAVHLTATDASENPAFTLALTIAHGMGGYDYFMVTNAGSQLWYANHVLSRIEGSGPVCSVKILKGFLLYCETQDHQKMKFDENGRMITTRTFWACNGVGDEYNFSKDYKMITCDPLPLNKGCIEVRIGIRNTSNNTVA